MKHRLLFVALLVCGTAQASDWVEAFHDETGRTYFDASRIKLSGDIRSGWIKVVLAPHTFTLNGQYQAEQVAHVFFDCRHETWRTDSATVYFEDGSNTSKSAPDEVFEPVTPDTHIEGEMKFICGLKPPLSHQ
jgi:hypothetical protein